MYEQSIELLNRALADELAAIHQYMYFHFHADDMGYAPLSTLFKQKAIEEMLHAERFAERVLFLKGDVEMRPAQEVERVHEVAGMLALAKASEESAVKMYNDFARRCGEWGDSASKQLFENIVLDEERHYDAFDKLEEHLRRFGEQWLALQSMQRDAGAPPAQA